MRDGDREDHVHRDERGADAREPADDQQDWRDNFADIHAVGDEAGQPHGREALSDAVDSALQLGDAVKEDANAERDT